MSNTTQQLERELYRQARLHRFRGGNWKSFWEQHRAEVQAAFPWASQAVYVEVWCEKDAIAGILSEVTDRWDVPLLVARGYSSLTFLYNSAMALRNTDKPCYVYQFGDHDPSGCDAWRCTEKALREFAPDVDLHCERIAVTPEQIEDLGLLTRPTKASDSRSRGFVGDSVEVDAIPPDTLRELVGGCIEQHVDQRRLRQLRTVEEAERETLQGIVGRFSNGEADE